MHGLQSIKNAADWLWLGLLLIMLLLLWHNKRQLRKKTTSWQHTLGRVNVFEWTHHGHLPWPKIEYTYEVDGVEYEGSAFFLPMARHDLNANYARQLAYRIAVAYDKDEPIDVYYNPVQPEQAVLDISHPAKLTLFIGFVIFLLALHLTVMVIHWW